MKGILVAVALALLAVVVFAWRGDQPELPVPVQPEAPAAEVEAEADAPPPARSVVEAPVAEPEVTEMPPAESEEVPEAKQPESPEWEPTVSEFVEAGLNQVQAEVLAAGLKQLRRRILEFEARAEQTGQASPILWQDRIVWQLAPGLAGAIKEKKISWEWSDKVAYWVARKASLAPEGAFSQLSARLDRGKVIELTCSACSARGDVSLLLPREMCNEELLRELEAVFRQARDGK